MRASEGFLNHTGVGKEYRKLTGESWYPITPPAPDPSAGPQPCIFCGATYDSYKGWVGCTKACKPF